MNATHEGRESMNTLDEIVQRLSNLSREKLKLVLAYVSRLEADDDLHDDPAEWSKYSLDRARDGLEDDGPEYTREDVKKPGSPP